MSKNDNQATPVEIENINDINSTLESYGNIARQLSKQLSIDADLVYNYIIAYGETAINMFKDIYTELIEKQKPYISDNELLAYTVKYNLPPLHLQDLDNEGEVDKVINKIKEIRMEEEEKNNPIIGIFTSYVGRNILVTLGVVLILLGLIGKLIDRYVPNKIELQNPTKLDTPSEEEKYLKLLQDDFEKSLKLPENKNNEIELYNDYLKNRLIIEQYYNKKAITQGKE